jgi:F0F1-type ATP synthase membrane subunit c/vacuolar-type H+-ATPase subunit K
MAEYFIYAHGEERPVRRLEIPDHPDASEFCVCGQMAGSHECPGDPVHPAARMLAEEAVRLYACGECGTEDPSVAGGGTALCQYCADLSALQAPAKERRWRRRVLTARFTGLALVAAVAIWLIVVSLLRGHPP